MNEACIQGNKAETSGSITEITLWDGGQKTYRTPVIEVEEGDMFRWGYRWFEIVRNGVAVRRVELSECELVEEES